jgi:NitT/TauT family transport system substrate-binding protein
LITLQESLRGLFYAPFYAALSRNAFAAEGVEVRFVSSPEPNKALDALIDGTADIGWGGPMRVNAGYRDVPNADFKCFAEVVTKDPFFLVTRDAKPPFNAADLMGLKLATVSEVPTPWLCLQHDIRLAGGDPTAINRITDRSMADNAAALLAGEVDVVQLFQPYVEELVEQGCHIWYAAADRGLCSYTTFYCRDSVMQAKRDEFAKMVRALYRTLQWVHSVDATALAEAAAPYFPAVPMPRLIAIIARYKALGIWGDSPVLPRAGYERLLASMVSAGFVNPGTPYEVAVDNSLAEAAMVGSD